MLTAQERAEQIQYGYNRIATRAPSEAYRNNYDSIFRKTQCQDKGDTYSGDGSNKESK